MRGARALASAAVVAIALLGAAPAPAATRTIYSSLAFAGADRAQSEDVLRGERLALEQAGGAIAGTRLRLVALNDATARGGRWDPLRTAQAARRAAEDATTIAYLGEFSSGATAISLPILNEAGIPQVSPSNTYVGLTRREGADRGEPGKYYPSGKRTYVRVVPADHLQARAIVTYLHRLRARRVFVVGDENSFGRGLAAMVRHRLRSRGLRLAGRATQRPPPGASALRIARAVRAVRADAMVFAGITADGAVRLFDAVHRLSPRARLVGADGVADDVLARRLSPGTARHTFLTIPTLAPSAYPPAGRLFDAGFATRFGHAPAPYAKYGYEAMALVLDAMRRVGLAPLSRDAVRRQLLATRDRDSVLGRYSIDRFGDTTLSTYGALRVRGGRLVYARVLRS